MYNRRMRPMMGGNRLIGGGFFGPFLLGGIFLISFKDI